MDDFGNPNCKYIYMSMEMHMNWENMQMNKKYENIQIKLLKNTLAIQTYQIWYKSANWKLEL